MKKRSISLILALIMCLSQLLIPVSATAVEKSLHFEMAAEAVYPGDEVTVTVNLTKNPGVSGLELTPTFDKKVFELVSMKGSIDGMVCTAYSTAVFDAMENVTYTGKALEIVLKAKADAVIGNYTVGLEILAFDVDGNEIEGSVAAATVTVAQRPVTGISLDKTELSLDQGASETLTATVEPENAGNKNVSWSSDKETVATVDANGVVTAVGPGSATITATTVDGGFTATCAVTVAGANVPVTGITLGSAPSAIIAGDEIALTATVTPDYATDKTVTWTSSNDAVATVDENGVVTAVGAGSVTITAAAGEVSATKTFKVFAKLYEATADGEVVKLEIPKYDNYNWYYLIKVPAGTETVGISGVGDLRFVNHGNKNPKNGDCPAGMTYEDGVLYMDLDNYTRNDSYMAPHYGLTYDKYTQRSLEFWGASNWNMTSFFVVIEPCEGEHSWIDATCTEAARCSVCGTTQGEALGHDWVETTAKVEPGCETTGTEAIETCQREGCGATQGGGTIAALGHSWKSSGINPTPTCTEPGTEHFICMRTVDCDGAKTEPVAALGHTWDEGTVTQEPTCTEKGTKYFVCTVEGCEGNKTEDIAALGHNYVDGYCSRENCGKMAPIAIPFTKPDGSAVHSKYDGKVDSLVVDGVKISHWDGFTQKSSLYTEQKITIYVDPADKDATATLSLKMKEGQSGSGGIIATPATVKLNNGVGSHTASYMYIGTGYTAPQLHLYINFALGYCTGEHEWVDATCTEPKTCSVCGKTEGEPNGHTWGEGSICTVEGCGASNVITQIEVSHPNLKNNAMTMAPGVTEQIDASALILDSAVASTQMIAWSSSDETVATVDQNGKVTALIAGTTTITAKAVDASGIALLADGEEVLAQFALTVADPAEGYTVTMGDDVENAVIGSNVPVPVTIGHTGVVTKYNAFDLSFEYDPAILELTSTAIEGMSVTAENGTIHVERYGTDLTVGSPALTLTFKTIATGDTNVKLTAAKVDIAESSLTQDAPDASVIDNLTRVFAKGYTVTLPTEFTGKSSILPGEDYTFTAKDKNYNYDVTAKIGDVEITVTDSGDGTFTIDDKDITGNIVITTEKSGKVFNVTLGDDMTGAETAQYMAEGGYTATLTKAAGYNYTVEVTIGGVKFTNFTYDIATGAISIPAEKIIGDIDFNTIKTAVTQDKHNVTVGGNSGDVTFEQEVTNGESYTFTINKEVGYKYTVTATMNGEPVEVKDNGDGTYTIENVTGDLEITVTKEYDLVVEVANYVNLNGKTMFLVTATGTVDEGSVLAYDGTAMFYSTQYNAWSYLVITEETLSVDDAKALITLIQGEKVELAQTYDVNESNNVDINDAQLVYDMYNNGYQDFTSASMQKFLNADVNGSKSINVEDAAAIVAQIIAAK